MEWKPEEHQTCKKMLELVGGGEMQCIQPSLATNEYCWEHQSQPDGNPQTSDWTPEQIESARVCNGIDLTASK